MKKSLLTVMLALAAIATVQGANEYTTPGNGNIYSFYDLSSMTTAVRMVQPGVYVVDSAFTVNDKDALTVKDNDQVQFANKVKVTVRGRLLLAPDTKAFFTRTDTLANPKGLYVTGDSGRAYLRNMVIDYVPISYGAKVYGFDARDCYFGCTTYSSSSSGAVAFNGSGAGQNVISNCTFKAIESSAISSGANIEAAVTIDSCTFIDCSTTNHNRPVINITTPGNAGTSYITHNKIYGAKRTMVGGIAVNNMMSLPEAKVFVKENYIDSCRYGITAIGRLKIYIVDNKLMHNRFEANPMNGGSGISLSCSSTTLKQFSYIEGNHIEGSLWGITLIGQGTFSNLGHLNAENADDVNPGNNVFKNNGNDSHVYDTTHPYDLYNNTPNEVWAQGNFWSVPQQTEALIETVIFHNNDDSTLGKVIFMPAGDASVGDITSDEPTGPVSYYNLQGQRVDNPERGLYIRCQGGKASKVYVK